MNSHDVFLKAFANISQHLKSLQDLNGQPQWPHGLMLKLSWTTRTLELWVRAPLEELSLRFSLLYGPVQVP